jgi:hypothetical protein
MLPWDVQAIAPQNIAAPVSPPMGTRIHACCHSEEPSPSMSRPRRPQPRALFASADGIGDVRRSDRPRGTGTGSQPSSAVCRDAVSASRDTTVRGLAPARPAVPELAGQRLGRRLRGVTGTYASARQNGRPSVRRGRASRSWAHMGVTRTKPGSLVAEPISSRTAGLPGSGTGTFVGRMQAACSEQGGDGQGKGPWAGPGAW